MKQYLLQGMKLNIMVGALLAVCGIFMSSPVYAGFTPTGSMNIERSLHTATLLANGKILIAGGWGYSGALSSAEIYDPTTGTFNMTRSMNSIRRGHSAILLPNGKVLIVGGWSLYGELSSAELYDPSSETFIDIGSMIIGRFDHTATLLPNGKVLIAGGRRNDGLRISNAELYDPTTDTFSASGVMNIPRDGHTATLLTNGKVLITGGTDRNGGDVITAELYDPLEGAFTLTGSLNTPRTNHTATLLMNGTVLIVGQGPGFLSNAELYNPISGNFVYAGSMNQPTVGGHTATLLSNDKVLITGGYDNNYQYKDNVELYDPADDTFINNGKISCARGYHTATLLPNNMVLIAGGGISSGFTGIAEIYANGASLPGTTYQSSDGPKPITDYSTVNSTITVPTNGCIISDVNVIVGITHTCISDLSIRLTHESSGRSVFLFNHSCYGTNISTIFDDQATSACQLVNTTIPAESLSIFNGLDAAGSWTLMVSDTAGADQGTLNSWGLTLGCGSTTPSKKVLTVASINPDAGVGIWESPNYLWLNTPSTLSYDTGTDVGLSAPDMAPGGNIFKEWSSCDYVYGNQCIVTMTTDRTVTATYIIPPMIAVTVATSPNGYSFTVDGATYTSSQTFYWLKGSSHTLATTSQQTDVGGSKYFFGGWSDGGNLSHTIYVPDSTVTYTATFVTNQGFFIPTESMSTKRQNHSATMLANGKILIAGGYGDDVLSSAELYDPVSGTFSPTGSLATARGSHTAILLPNGKVLILGGWNHYGNFPSCSDLSSAELYDPDTGIFTPIGSMSTTREDYTATLLSNGKVLIAGGDHVEWHESCDGGTGHILNSAELYDPTTGAFNTTGSMAVARDSHTATLLPNGKVLIAGGGWTSNQRSSELYDPATGSFTLTGSLATKRDEHTATLLPNGSVLIVGGYVSWDENNNSYFQKNAELYDPDTGSFAPAGSLAIGRFYHTATLLTNGKVLFTGGNSDGGNLSSGELYDPLTKTFTLTGCMNTSRAYHTANLLPNGTVLVVGGESSAFNEPPLNSTELYIDQMILPQSKVLTVTSVNPASGISIKVSPADSQGNADGATQFTRNYVAGIPVTLTATATSPGGNVFKEWNGCDGVSGAQCSVTMTADRTVTATYMSATVSIIIATAPDGLSFSVDGVRYSSSQTFDWLPGSSHTIAITSPQNGTAGKRYVFDNWSNGGAMSHTITVPTSPATYTANFTTQYQLTTAAGSGGSVSPASGNWYNSGSVVNLQATANNGYAFVSWGGPVANAANAATTVTMNQPQTVAASFTLLPGSVTIQTSPIGRSFTVDGVTYNSTQTFNWTPGSPHTISSITPQAVAPGVRHIFAAWSDNGGPMSRTIFASGGQPVTFTAYFAAEYQLTTATNPEGAGAISPSSSNWYQAGTPVSLTAIPNNNYSFLSWSGPVVNPSSAVTAVIMNGPTIVTANLTGAPLLTASIGTKSGLINSRVWPITVINSGQGMALDARINSLTLNQTYGTGCTPIVTMPFPQQLGNIGVVASATAPLIINFSGCAPTARFTAVINYSASNSGGGSKTFVNQFR